MSGFRRYDFYTTTPMLPVAYNASGNEIGLGDDGFDTSTGGSAGAAIATGITPSGAITRQGGDVDWGAIANAVLPTALSVYQQQQLTRLNVARINSGQQPLTAAQYSAMYQPPTAQVQFGTTPQGEKLLTFGAIGVAIYLGLKALKIV